MFHPRFEKVKIVMLKNYTLECLCVKYRPLERIPPNGTHFLRKKYEGNGDGISHIGLHSIPRKPNFHHRRSDPDLPPVTMNECPLKVMGKRALSDYWTPKSQSISSGTRT